MANPITPKSHISDAITRETTVHLDDLYESTHEVDDRWSLAAVKNK